MEDARTRDIYVYGPGLRPLMVAVAIMVAVAAVVAEVVVAGSSRGLRTGFALPHPPGVSLVLLPLLPRRRLRLPLLPLLPLLPPPI